MFDIKIQCEHYNGMYAWFTIVEWRCGVHSVRQLISVLERYHRIREILERIPEQEKASGNAVEVVKKTNGIGFRTKHSYYAGVTGVRLVSSLRDEAEPTPNVIEQWLKREGKLPENTPDVSIMSNRQLAALTAQSAARAPSSRPPAAAPPLTPIEQRAEQITTELLQQKPGSNPPPRRRIIDAPKAGNTHATRPPPMQKKEKKRHAS